MRAALGGEHGPRSSMTLFLRRSVKFCSLALDGSKHGHCLSKSLELFTKDLTQSQRGIK